MPGDRGLPALGLLMQLMGGIEALLQMLLAIVALRMAGALTLGTVIVLGLGIARAVAHFVAGTEIRAGGMQILRRVRVLVLVSALSFGVVMWLGDGPLGDRLLVASDPLWWPLVLGAVLHTPRWRERLARVGSGEESLVDPNRSIEAVGAVMVALGTIGVLITGSVLWASLDGPAGPGLLGSGSGMLGGGIVLGAAALLLRGLYHVSVGVRALRGATPTGVHRMIDRYAKLCWVTLAIAIAPVAYGIVEGVPMMGTLAIAMVTLLGLWPVLLRGWAVQVGGEFGEVDDLGFTPAPDSGLVSVGWLLCAVVAGSAVPSVVALLDGVAKGAALDDVGWFLDPSLPVWTGIVGVAVCAWASMELLTLSARARLAALIAGLTTVAFALWAHGEALGELALSTLRSLGRIEVVLAQADLLASLVVPVMILVLVVRSLRRAGA